MGGNNFDNPISNDPKSNVTDEELGLVILRTIFTKRYCYVEHLLLKMGLECSRVSYENINRKFYCSLSDFCDL